MARRGRNGTAEAEEHAFQRVLERMLCRDGIRIGAYDYISHHHILGACHITSLCFGVSIVPSSNLFSKQKLIARAERVVALN